MGKESTALELEQVAQAIKEISLEDGSGEGVCEAAKIQWQFDEYKLDWLDALYVLQRCPAIKPGDHPSCFIVEGLTLDGDAIGLEVAICEPRGRIKVINIWRQ